MVLDVKPGPTSGRSTFNGRSTVLFRINALFKAGSTIGNLASSSLMTRGTNLWSLWVIGETLVWISVFIAFLLPSAPTARKSPNGNVFGEAEEPDDNRRPLETLKATVRVRIQEGFDNVRCIVGDHGAVAAMLLLSMSFFGNLGFDSLNMELFISYVSKRYDQEFAWVSAQFSYA